MATGPARSHVKLVWLPMKSGMVPLRELLDSRLNVAGEAKVLVLRRAKQMNNQRPRPAHRRCKTVMFEKELGMAPVSVLLLRLLRRGGTGSQSVVICIQSGIHCNCLQEATRT